LSWCLTTFDRNAADYGLPAGSGGVPCSWHHLANEGLMTILPTEYSAWEGVSKRASAPRRMAGPARHRPEAHPAAFAIASPPDGATYLIDPTLRREFQSLPLRATTAAGTRVEWRVNGKRIGEAGSESPLSWPLMPGKHRITARDTTGREASATVIVR
jgi:membrane carboxypeptidase/penicillin-binding protein PbpC